MSRFTPASQSAENGPRAASGLSRSTKRDNDFDYKDGNNEEVPSRRERFDISLDSRPREDDMENAHTQYIGHRTGSTEKNIEHAYTKRLRYPTGNTEDPLSNLAASQSYNWARRLSSSDLQKSLPPTARYLSDIAHVGAWVDDSISETTSYDMSPESFSRWLSEELTQKQHRFGESSAAEELSQKSLKLHLVRNARDALPSNVGRDTGDQVSLSSTISGRVDELASASFYPSTTLLLSKGPQIWQTVTIAFSKAGSVIISDGHRIIQCLLSLDTAVRWCNRFLRFRAQHSKFHRDLTWPAAIRAVPGGIITSNTMTLVLGLCYFSLTHKALDILVSKLEVNRLACGYIVAVSGSRDSRRKAQSHSPGEKSSKRQKTSAGRSSGNRTTDRTAAPGSNPSTIVGTNPTWKAIWEGGFACYWFKFDPDKAHETCSFLDKDPDPSIWQRALLYTDRHLKWHIDRHDITEEEASSLCQSTRNETRSYTEDNKWRRFFVKLFPSFKDSENRLNPYSGQPLLSDDHEMKTRRALQYHEVPGSGFVQHQDIDEPLIRFSDDEPEMNAAETLNPNIDPMLNQVMDALATSSRIQTNADIEITSHVPTESNWEEDKADETVISPGNESAFTMTQSFQALQNTYNKLLHGLKLLGVPLASDSVKTQAKIQMKRDFLLKLHNGLSSLESLTHAVKHFVDIPLILDLPPLNSSNSCDMRLVLEGYCKALRETVSETENVCDLDESNFEEECVARLRFCDALKAFAQTPRLLDSLLKALVENAQSPSLTYSTTEESLLDAPLSPMSQYVDFSALDPNNSSGPKAPNIRIMPGSLLKIATRQTDTVLPTSYAEQHLRSFAGLSPDEFKVARQTPPE